MRTSELLAALPPHLITARIGSFPETVGGLAYDSRRVSPGDVFVCWKGYRHDGHAFAPEAVRRGAAALVCEQRLEGIPVPQLLVRDAREALARLAAAYYDYPSRKLQLIGVTGTNGKTTTSYLIKSVLDAAGCRTGLIGTIQYLIGDEPLDAPHTTPESLELQALLDRMVQRGVTHCVMEVSSHAVALKRTFGCRFAAGVFTNITQDHLDFHPSFSDYLKTKASFLAQVGESDAGAAVVVNADDPHVEEMVASCRAPVMRYGLVNEADFVARDVTVKPDGVSYTARTPRGELGLSLHLTGRFNVYNSLAALAVGEWAAVDPQAIKRGLEGVRGVPGRFERIDAGQDFTVLVDYAHTPDGLENVLRAARSFTEKQLWVVFGCGGDRDPYKRPLMGEVAARLADRVVITSDNPRSEDPEAICREIWNGAQRVGNGAEVEVIVERREAIRRAISLAQPGDLVLIAGKGHETYQIFRDRTVHFDDREEAARALEERLRS